MNNITQDLQQDKPRPVSQLEYARMIEATHGPQAPVTWLSVSDLIALLEADQAQAQAVELPAQSWLVS